MRVRGCWGDSRWRGSVLDDDDIADSACIVDLLDFAVANRILVRTLALARNGRRCGHGVEIAVQGAIKGGVRVLG